MPALPREIAPDALELPTVRFHRRSRWRLAEATAWADAPLPARLFLFLAVLIPTVALTIFTVVRSRRLAEFLDKLSDERLEIREKWTNIGELIEDLQILIGEFKKSYLEQTDWYVEQDTIGDFEGLLQTLILAKERQAKKVRIRIE